MKSKMSNLQSLFLPAIEAELQHQVSRLDGPHTKQFHEMLTYHMGWAGEGAGLSAQGKRLRPMLLLLCCAASGGDWHNALPAAASVELIHNFSLIHDDIQDRSDTRRGRTTLWSKWGMPQGINAGDALFAISNLSLLDLQPATSCETVIKAAEIIHTTCLNLTKGQFLDMSFENGSDHELDDYWVMVGGKTAALFSAACEIGSLIGQADTTIHEAYRNFGHYLGLAFQVRDDFLGIWGDATLTGKSIESDLVSGKLSLPVLFGLGKKSDFSKRWLAGAITADEVAPLSKQLEIEGAKLFSRQTEDQLTDLALQSLRSANPEGTAGQELFDLIYKLVGRQV
jgi:geranylgeranyl diphosphate synthase type I